jgi:hypothetical protein
MVVVMARSSMVRIRLPQAPRGSFRQAVLLLLAAGSGLAAGEQATRQEAIAPADVFVRVGLVRGEIEQIRFVMGRPQNKQPEIGVKGAAPREVYFQALTLFRKLDRLCFELARERTAEPELPQGEITPSDVYEVVDAALAIARRIKDKLGIVETAEPPRRDPEKTPTDVFRSIVQANRQVNLLLDQRYAPSDVFQQVTRAVALTSRLLEHFPGATTMPSAPDFEEGKRPAHVYRRLIDCYRKIRSIASKSDVDMLEFEANDALIDQAAPSDVYDIASLIVSELAHLHARLPDAQPPRKVYYVGRKFPSHVYQRAGLLERQLSELARHVEDDAGWLNSSAEADE